MHRASIIDTKLITTWRTYDYPLRARYLLLLPCACVLLLNGCDFDKRDFINTARTTFESICNGDPSAEKAIDWYVIRINDEELGRTYMQLTTDYERAEFRKSITSRLRKYYASRGWTPQRVRGWKIQARGVESATVVAAPPGGIISMSLQKHGAEKKIILIEDKQG